MLAMGFMSLMIFTEDIAYCRQHWSGESACKMNCLFVAMSSLALTGLGLHGAYNVRACYVLAFSLLQLVLLTHKCTTDMFQDNMIKSMFMHMAHLVALFCGFAFSCLSVFIC